MDERGLRIAVMADKSSADFANEAARSIGTRALEEALRMWSRVSRACESEIEKAFIAGILDSADVCPLSEQLILHDGSSKNLEAPYPGIHIWPQTQIGKYRVDFLLIGRHFPPPNFDRPKEARIVIECDGHDFHERTKEQAERDKKRDRELIARGYTVLRFTGREIWRDPRECADQVFEQVERAFGYLDAASA